jgi:RNA polymerase sigma factor (TIGR02999 family)
MAEPSPGNDDLYESAYNELRRRAKYFLSTERPGHTLRPTEIVHEAWIRMRAVDSGILERRDQFLALAGRVMRNLLVDYARSRGAKRRGGDYTRVELSPNLFSTESILPILVIDEILNQIAAIDPRVAQVVELRFFAGLTEDDVARVLGISSRTVKRDWGFAKAWIRSNLGGKSSKPSEEAEDAASDDAV